MSILEKLNAELITCENQLRQCDEIIIKQQERRSCYAERKNLLEDLIKSVTAEQNTVDKTKTNETKPAKKPRTKNHTDPIENAETDKVDKSNATKQTVDVANCISMKDLADEIHESQSNIANISNKLGFNLIYVDNKYMFTKEQADAVKAELKK